MLIISLGEVGALAAIQIITQTLLGIWRHKPYWASGDTNLTGHLETQTLLGIWRHKPYWASGDTNLTGHLEIHWPDFTLCDFSFLFRYCSVCHLYVGVTNFDFVVLCSFFNFFLFLSNFLSPLLTVFVHNFLPVRGWTCRNVHHYSSLVLFSMTAWRMFPTGPVTASSNLPSSKSYKQEITQRIPYLSLKCHILEKKHQVMTEKLQCDKHHLYGSK